jgi:hypothetical protein
MPVSEAKNQITKTALRAGPHTRWLEDHGYVDDGTRPARKIRELAHRLDVGAYNADDDWALHGVRKQLEQLATTYLGQRVRFPLF